MILLQSLKKSYVSQTTSFARSLFEIYLTVQRLFLPRIYYFHDNFLSSKMVKIQVENNLQCVSSVCVVMYLCICEDQMFQTFKIRAFWPVLIYAGVWVKIKFSSMLRTTKRLRIGVIFIAVFPCVLTDKKTSVHTWHWHVCPMTVTLLFIQINMSVKQSGLEYGTGHVCIHTTKRMGPRPPLNVVWVIRFQKCFPCIR